MSEDRKQALKKHLEFTRQQLWDALEGISDDQWNIPVQAGGEQWTVLQMLRHLQDAQHGLTGQAGRILAGEETVPRDFDVDRWNARVQRKTAEANMTAEEAIERLKAGREVLLQLVDTITDADWDKMGWQPSFKQDISLEKFIYIIGAHEALHAREIAEALGKGG